MAKAKPAKGEKTPAAISKEDFKAKAKPLTLVIEGSTQTALTKEFSSGSYGWYFGDKVTIMIDGVAVRCQVGMNITVIGSKPSE